MGGLGRSWPRVCIGAPSGRRRESRCAERGQAGRFRLPDGDRARWSSPASGCGSRASRSPEPRLREPWLRVLPPFEHASCASAGLDGAGPAAGLAAHQAPVRRRCRQALCPVRPSSPMLGRSPTAGAVGSKRRWPSEPPSSSGLGHRPFKAAARVQIPLGALCWPGRRAAHDGPVEQLGVLATLSRWRSRVQIPSGPLSRGVPRHGQVAQSV